MADWLESSRELFDGPGPRTSQPDDDRAEATAADRAERERTLADALAAIRIFRALRDQWAQASADHDGTAAGKLRAATYAAVVSHLDAVLRDLPE